MAKIESFAFSLGLLMAGLLVLSTVAPVGAAADTGRNSAPVAGLAVARAA